MKLFRSTGHNGGPCLDDVSCGEHKHPVDALSFKKCWGLIKLRTDRHERLLFAAYIIAGTHHRPDMIRALAEFAGVKTRAATKWIDGDCYPKGEMEFFTELMDFYGDDWRALALAMNDYLRGKIFWGMK